MLLRFDESRAKFAAVATIYRSTGNRLNSAYLLFNQCSVEIQSGLIDAAVRHVRQQLEALGDSTSRLAFSELKAVRAIIAASSENRWPPLA